MMIRPLLAAIQFLTVIPFPKSLNVGEEELKRCVPFFPVVGLLIGMVIATFDYVMGLILPPVPACVMTAIAMTGISGGLHMDGLADTADGFFSARPRERILEIMRDSRTGVMGVLGVVFVIVLKVSLLISIIPPFRPGVIVLMPMAGRCSFVMMMTVLPYVRREGGLATAFGGRRSWTNVLWAFAFLLAAGWAAGHWMGFVSSLSALLVSALFSAYCFCKIGGYTGDTLGAGCELTEIIPALSAVVLLNTVY